MAGTYTYDAGDISTDLAKIRTNIQDVGDNSVWILSDEQIQAMIDQTDDLWHASAMCCLAIAGSNALLAQAIKAGAYSEDYSIAARELRQQAKAFMEWSQVPYDETAEMALTDFNYREMVINKNLREQ